MNTNALPLQSVVSIEERRWSVGIHVGAMLLALLTSWAAGLAGVAAAAVILVMKPMGSEFIESHAREALNFNLSMFIYLLIGGLFSILTFGLGLLVVIPLAIVLALVWLVCSIMAAVAANEGNLYRYPFTIRLIR